MSLIRAISLVALACTFLPSCESLGDLFIDRSDGQRLADSSRFGPWCLYYDAKVHPKARGYYEEDERTNLWSYWNADGSPRWRGALLGKSIHGPQTFWHDNGAVSAQGLYVDGRESGLWRFWGSDGTLEQIASFDQGRRSLRTLSFSSEFELLTEDYFRGGKRMAEQDDAQLVRDMWPGHSVKREGFLVGGQQDGLWVLWHENGNPRLAGPMAAGVATGLWQAWAPDGSLIGTVPIENGRVEAGCLLASTMLLDAYVPGVSMPFQAFREKGSAIIQDEGECASLRKAVEFGLAEMRAVTSPGRLDSFLGSMDGRAGLELNLRRPEPIPSVGPTDKDATLRNDLIERFTSTPGLGGGGKYSSGDPARGRSVRDAQLSDGLLGRVLKDVVLVGQDDGEIALEDYSGKPVLLLILRGLDPDACVYCVSQVSAMASNIEAFNSRGVEVVVLIPGSQAQFGGFRKFYQECAAEAQDGSVTWPPPFAIGYDAYDLVSGFGIAAKMAKPTALILDEKRLVRYAFVGRDVQDRPSIEALVDFVKEMQAEDARMDR